MEFRLVPVNHNALFSKYRGQYQLQQCEITVDTSATLTLHEPYMDIFQLQMGNLKPSNVLYLAIIGLSKHLQQKKADISINNIHPHFDISSGN